MAADERVLRKRVLGAGVLLAVLVLLAFGALQIYIHAFYRSPWQTVPSQLSTCGRDYIYPDTAHPQTRAAASRDEGTAIHEVGSTSGWVRTRAIWGHRYGGPDYAGTRCGTLIWLRAGPDRFIEYVLSGGP